MKALGIAFSARKAGNCLNCIEYVLTKLKEQGFTIEVINAYNFEIRDRLDNLVKSILKNWKRKR
jgi:multimeric flavodoxin WrbA